ncbi:MAG: ABC transporter ATP-binding protein [Lachnospiraceae bacterium]|nr:ABC transporter ATP-binding protein [Lachnospiraceae bacterium]
MSDICLKFENVCGKSKNFALKDVCFSLEPGFIYAIAGENGSGKSTLMKYILSEKKLYTGRILFEGEDINGRHKELMNAIGFVSEDNRFFEERSAKQNGELLGGFYDKFDMELYKETLKSMDIAESHTYMKMSRGEKIKMQLAFAIAHGSRFFLLDEATAGLDPVYRIEFFNVLRKLLAEKNITVLMSSHNMTEIEKNTDYVAIMKEGRLGGFNESI